MLGLGIFSATPPLRFLVLSALFMSTACWLSDGFSVMLLYLQWLFCGREVELRRP